MADGRVDVIDIDDSDTQIAFFNTEQTMYSVLIPSGKLGTKNGLRLTIQGKIRFGASDSSFTVRMKYGNTTFPDLIVEAVESTSIDRSLTIIAYLSADGDVSRQVGHIQSVLGVRAEENAGGQIAGALSFENSNNEQVFSVTGQYNVANANNIALAQHKTLEYIVAPTTDSTSVSSASSSGGIGAPTAQILTSSKLNQLSHDMRKSILLYAPLISDIDSMGPAVSSFARGTQANAFYRDGFWHNVDPNVPTFEWNTPEQKDRPRGMFALRETTNFLLQSEFPDVSPWTKGTGVTLTANFDVGPFGAKTAYRLFTPPGLSSSVGQTVSVGGDAFIGTRNRPFTLSVWMKNTFNAPSQVVPLTLRDSLVAIKTAGITVDNVWRRYAISGVAGSTALVLRANINDNPTAAIDVLIYGAQVEESPSIQNYVKTLTATSFRTNDAMSWTSGKDFSVSTPQGSIFYVLENNLGVNVPIGVTYDYSRGDGQGIETEYTLAGVNEVRGGRTQLIDINDGLLSRFAPLNRHIKHVLTFNRLLNNAEVSEVLRVLNEVDD